MIAFPDSLPRVMWNNDRLIPLSEGWISESIEESAQRAGVQRWPWTLQVSKAIVHHLEESCEKMTISKDELDLVLQATLMGIGHGDIAKYAKLSAPRVSIYLPDLARETGHEILFFQNLMRRLDEAVGLRVNGVRLESVRECVKILESAVKWRQSCDALRDEIVNFARLKVNTSATPKMELLIQ
jgi:hypothetical protein